MFPTGPVEVRETRIPRRFGEDLEAKVAPAVAYMSPQMKPSGGLKVPDSIGDFMSDAFGPVADLQRFPMSLVKPSEPYFPLVSGAAGLCRVLREPTDEATRRLENAGFYWGFRGNACCLLLFLLLISHAS